MRVCATASSVGSVCISNHSLVFSVQAAFTNTNSIPPPPDPAPTVVDASDDDLRRRLVWRLKFSLDQLFGVSADLTPAQRSQLHDSVSLRVNYVQPPAPAGAAQTLLAFFFFGHRVICWCGCSLGLRMRDII